MLGSESVNAELDEMPHSIIVAKMPGPENIKLFAMLNSAEHEIYPVDKC